MGNKVADQSKTKDILINYNVEVNKDEVVICLATCPLENPDNSITWQVDKISILQDSV